jgi:hypothetical protein
MLLYPCQAIKRKDPRYFDTSDPAKYNATMFARRTEKLKAKKMKETKVTRDKERRHRQPWYLEFASARGKKWLEKAMQDDAFRLGMGAKVHDPRPPLAWHYHDSYYKITHFIPCFDTATIICFGRPLSAKRGRGKFQIELLPSILTFSHICKSASSHLRATVGHPHITGRLADLPGQCCPLMLSCSHLQAVSYHPVLYLPHCLSILPLSPPSLPPSLPLPSSSLPSTRSSFPPSIPLSAPSASLPGPRAEPRQLLHRRPDEAAQGVQLGALRLHQPLPGRAPPVLAGALHLVSEGISGRKGNPADPPINEGEIRRIRRIRRIRQRPSRPELACRSLCTVRPLPDPRAIPEILVPSPSMGRERADACEGAGGGWGGGGWTSQPDWAIVTLRPRQVAPGPALAAEEEEEESVV